VNGIPQSGDPTIVTDYIAPAAVEGALAMLYQRFRNSVKTSCKIMQMKEISSPCNNEADAVWRPDVTVAAIVARDKSRAEQVHATYEPRHVDAVR
jgi:hypothetical protein